MKVTMGVGYIYTVVMVLMCVSIMKVDADLCESSDGEYCMPYQK